MIEHTIDLGVARRMKRQGMRWSKEGAHNLLVMRGPGVRPGGLAFLVERGDRVEPITAAHPSSKEGLSVSPKTGEAKEFEE